MLSKVSASPMPGDGARDARPGMWSGAVPGNAASRRRKKIAIRTTQLAMAAMVAIAIAGAILGGAYRLGALRLGALIATGVAYIGWSLLGSRQAVRFALWDHDSAPPPALGPDVRLRSILHLLVQFSMAELIVWLAGPAGVLGLLWLVFLPPVGQSVIRLTWPGIVVASTVSIGLYSLNVAWWHGGLSLTQALPGFSIAVLFTLAFTQITVSAERARGEVERLAAELGDANARLREYALQAEELAATRERNRVAREIHDSVGHCLTVVHVQLEAARTTFDRDPAQALEAIGKAQAVTHEGLQEIRRSVAALRGSPLQNRPLPEAIRQLVAESCAAGLAAEFVVIGAARKPSPQAELSLFRAAQEGLTNCRKHARAGSARLVLDFQSADVLRLTISDDGVGAGDATGGFGLLGLRERAQLLGGRVVVQTAPGQGFVLEMEVPA